MLWAVGMSASLIGISILVFPDRMGAVLPLKAGGAMVLWVLVGAPFMC